MMQEILEAIRPALFEMLMGLIWLALTYLAVIFQRFTGVTVKDSQMHIAHSAIRNGVLAAMERGLTTEVFVDAVKDYVRASSPDAIRALGYTDQVLTSQIIAKKAELTLKGSAQ